MGLEVESDWSHRDRTTAKFLDTWLECPIRNVYMLDPILQQGTRIVTAMGEMDQTRDRGAWFDRPFESAKAPCTRYALRACTTVNR